MRNEDGSGTCVDCGTVLTSDTYPSDRCNKCAKKVGLHVHPAYFGSELACKICNPHCYKNHGIGKELFCGNPKCPMSPVN